jgi:hypothetical protein
MKLGIGWEIPVAFVTDEQRAAVDEQLTERSNDDDDGHSEK